MKSTHCLLVAKAKCVHGFEKSLNAWYFSHLPKRLQAPGFLWGFRYQSVKDPSSFVALYGIESPTYLSSLLNEDISKRHPLIASPEFNAPPQGLEYTDIGIYQIKRSEPLEAPLLLTDSAISLEAWDWNSKKSSLALAEACDEHYLQEMLNFPFYRAGHRFEQIVDPDIAYTNQMPQNLILFEYESPKVDALAQRPKLSSRIEPLMRRHSQGSYQLISKNWPVRIL
jgi:hypothetical protein